MDPNQRIEGPRSTPVNFFSEKAAVLIQGLRKAASMTIVAPIIEGYRIERKYPNFKQFVSDEVRCLPRGLFYLCIGISDQTSSYSTLHLLSLPPQEIAQIPFRTLNCYQISLCCQIPEVLENLSGDNLSFLCHFIREDNKNFTDLDQLPVAPFLALSRSSLLKAFTHFNHHRSEYPTLPERILAAIEGAELREILSAELQRPVEKINSQVDERTPLVKSFNQGYGT